MNNIYQVIWSHVKHCYVVTSELAKRHGKRDNGRGVRGMRMGVGGLRRGALALGVTAALLSGWTGVGTSVAHAENVPGGSEITISDNQSDVIYNLNGSNITFTVASGGNVHDISGSVNTSITLNKVFVYGTVNGRVFGGRAIGDGAVTENSVTVSGDAALINGEVYGGYADVGLKASGSATGNKVFIYGGTIKKGVYGGYSYSRDANENEVTIENGSVVSVTGGFSPARAAIKNRVTISGGTVTSTGVRAVVGGAGGSTSEDSVTQENEVIIKGNAKVDGSVIGGADTASSYAVNYAAVVNNNRLTIQDSAVISGSMYGGYGNLNVKDKTENKVFIKGGSVSGNVYGGYITNYIMGAVEEPAGNVKKNEIHITGGTVGTNDKTVIAGGYVDEFATGAAMDNAVTITGGTVKSRVFGGHVNNATSAATGNKLNISVKDASVADTVLERNAYGGYAYGTGEVSNNNVTITGGTLNYNVYAGYSERGAAHNNTVDISGKNTNVGFGVYGGYNDKTDNAEYTVNNNTVKITDATIGGEVTGGDGVQDVFENRVEITGGKLGQMDAVSLVTGGDAYDGSGSATKNEVKISGGTQLIGEVYGGYTSNSQTANNIVTLDNVTVKKAEEGYRGNVYGGSSEGDATGNSVTISGAETQVEGKVYGGNVFKSKVSADATGNTVEIKGGTIGKSDGDTVFGGYTNNGDSKQNNVIITGGTVNGDVFGGYSGSYNYIYGDSEQNNVNITGGTVNGNVYGGYSDSDASGNSVTISGGTVKGRVYGGYANSDATGNTVTLSNCTINGEVFGSWNLDGEMKNNTVNLTGKVSGLDGEDSDVSGCGWNNSDNTGNELHIGGTKDGSITGAWQGMTGDAVTNKITSVELFESIVYHNVKWDENVPALEVNTLSYVDAIDITNLAFDSLGTGTMALLKATSDDSDLSSIKLNYSGGTGVDITTGGVVLSGGTPTTEKDGVNGVKLTQSSSDKVLLASDKKAINYSKGATTVSAITFGTFDIDKGARDLNGSSFATANTVDAKDLKFADTANALKANDSITLVTNATGIATTVANETDKTIAIKDYMDAQKIKYNATASGTVTSAGGAVKYTVDSVTLNTVALAGWTGTTSDVTKETKGWTVADGTKVNTDGISVSGMNPGDSRTILTADTSVKFATKHLTGGNVWQEGGAIDDSGDKTGVTIAGTTTGGGVKVNESNASQLIYQQSKNDVTGIALGEVKYDTTKAVRSFGNAYDLTKADIDASGFTISNLKDVKADMKSDDILVVVDAEKAIANAKGETLKGFTAEPSPISVDFKDEKVDGKELTLEGTHKDTLSLNEKKTQVVYKVGEKEVAKATFTGQVAWNDSEAYYDAMKGTEKYKFGATAVDAENLKVTGTTTKALKKGEAMTLLSAKAMTASLDKDQSDANKKASKITVNYSDTASGLVFGAEATGEVKVATNAVNYEVTGVAMSSADLKGWKGTAFDMTSGNTKDWALADGATVKTDGMTAPTVDPGEHKDIIKGGPDNFFANVTFEGGNVYDPAKPAKFTEKDGGITFAGTQAKGATLNEKKNHIVYAAGTKDVTTATLEGEIAWKDGGIYYDNTKYNFTDDSETEISGVKFTADTDPLAGDTKGMTLIKNAGGKVVNTGSPEFSVSLKNTTLNATATGTSETGTGNLVFTVDSVTLDSVTVNSAGNDMVPAGWEVAEKLTVDTSKMEVPSDAAYGKPQSVLTANSAIFTDDSITGDNKYAANPAQFTDEDGTGAVEISGKQDAGVKASTDGKSLVYEMGKKEVSAVTLGEVKWAAGAELLKAGSEEYDYTNAAVNNSLTVAYDAPENVAANQSMTLLKANKTLADMAEQEKQHEYKYNDVPGVTVDAKITGKLAAKDGAVTFTAAENKASLLTFEKVEWTGDKPLINHSETLKNVSFDGATVDTSNIDFYKEMYIEADQKTTLVSDFGGTPKEIKGSKYMVGTAFDGEGSATMENGNLIFRTKTSAGVSEQTHKAVMGVEATMGLLATGKEHEGNVLDGLGNLSNVDSDGASVAASFGGGKDRYETGSHVNINSWSAAVGVGARKETKKGTLQYGIFGEYGKGNYTMHSDVGRSDGDAHYAGGGLMAKWTNKHDVYTEASFRLGRVSDSANDLLRDGAGNAYGYDIHATYYGAHVGLGKIFNYKGGKSLDVYGKFFYTKRDGAEFDAKQHYNLDSVNSSVLRIGARYGTTDKKWNWYGGLAYEYEFDGEAKGTVNGTEIRAASIKGSSVRGEFGMRMDATKDNPWRTDISIYGYGGKHRGFGGSVNVAYTF